MVKDTIINGDAYKLIKEVPDKYVDLVYTDIPYLGGYSKAHSHRKRIDRISETNKFYSGIDLSIIDDFIRVMKKTNMYIWCSNNQIIPIVDRIIGGGGNKVQWKLLVWHKKDCVLINRRQYVPDLEYCIYFTEGQGINDLGYWLSKQYESSTNKEENKMYGHCTTKPYDMVRTHVLASTNTGDMVLDPFSGSGTTCSVCKNEGRHYLGFEIDAKYYKASIDRLNGITVQDREAIDEGQLRLF